MSRRKLWEPWEPSPRQASKPLRSLTVLDRWRIGIDEEVVAALTEPRYPSPNNDNSLEAIILTQTVYLCQLFLHLQEFDPCAIGDSDVPDEDFVRPFQDSLQREFNGLHAGPVRDGPAPDGEVLERVVRGLMLAQREDPPTSEPTPQTTPATDPTKAQLHQVLLSILKELNGPLHNKPLRYEVAHGKRENETWAARFATRIMQWRGEMKTNPAWLAQEVIRVNRHDVCPLDEEGLEVYKVVRNAAPGTIHLATPLQPEMALRPRRPAAYYAQQPDPQQFRGQQTQHQRSISEGITLQQMLATPVAQSPASTPTQSSDTPRTTPQCHQQQRFAPGHSMKRSSQDMGFESSKRHRSSQEGPEEAGVGEEAPATRGFGADVGTSEFARLKAPEPSQTDIPLRVVPGAMDVDDSQQHRATAAAEETNVLLRRVLDGMSALGRKMDAVQTDMGDRLAQLDTRLRHIQDWIGVEDEEEQ